jgi:hypothetical protein
LELFERVCIPSVLNLIPRPDGWFIGFGDVEPAYILGLLERLSIYPWIRPYVRRKGESGSDAPVEKLLGDHARLLGKSYVCSTRFDSDDSLHRQFIGALDRAISQLRERGFPDQPRCLNVLYGLMQTGGELSVYLRRTNMFESIFEPVDTVKGPYLGGHDDIRALMPLVEVVTNLPMWIYHRHQDALEPSWVTARDRLPLTNPEQHYPLFGLPPETAAALKAQASAPSDETAPPRVDPRGQASALRDAPFWRSDQLAAAVELASAQSQPELARWLAAPANEEIDAALVLCEFEAAPLAFLNGSLHAHLAKLLLEQGEIVGALRAYDYAMFLAPTDRHVRAARDALAGSLLSELDFDEQLDLAGIAQPAADASNAVVIVASTPAADSDPGDLESLRARAGHFASTGLITYVLMLPDPEQHGDGLLPAAFGDGVVCESLSSPEAFPAGPDAVRRAHVRKLAKRVAEIRPYLLAADGTLVAQSLAASVGRAFAIPVDFQIASAPIGNIEPDMANG